MEKEKFKHGDLVAWKGSLWKVIRVKRGWVKIVPTTKCGSLEEVLENAVNVQPTAFKKVRGQVRNCRSCANWIKPGPLYKGWMCTVASAFPLADFAKAATAKNGGRVLSALRRCRR